jgi:ribosomal protein S27AE
MFLRQYNGWREEGTSTQTTKCPNCGNTTEHYIYVAPHGFQIGLAFMAKPLLGAKKYFLACSKCDHLTKELSKEQVQVMRRQA